MVDQNAVYKDREYVVRYTTTESGEPAMMIVRELVRCKDCAYKTSCTRNLSPFGKRDNDYCSYGNRW